MKIDKLFKSIEKLFFSQDDQEKQEELREKLIDKIEATRQELSVCLEKEKKDALKDKLYILKKLLKRVKV
ncbi:MAG: hypothetical protein GX780_05685 [Campylobacteraceae bacterium]|nr:hypothetical protein [Campylobacteraceae bacterium]